MSGSIISKEQVEKVAGLARIKLNEEEKERFASDLSGILGHFKDLSELDVRNVESFNHLVGEQNALEKDEIREASDDVKAAIRDEFPKRSGDYLAVKTVM